MQSTLSKFVASSKSTSSQIASSTPKILPLKRTLEGGNTGKKAKKRTQLEEYALDSKQYMRDTKSIANVFRNQHGKLQNDVIQQLRKDAGKQVTTYLPENKANDEVAITSWNVNSLRAAVQSNFFDIFKSWKPQPEIVFLQEIKAKEQDVVEFVAEIKKLGYNAIINSGTCAGYAGTAVLYKTDFMPLTVAFNEKLAYETDDDRTKEEQSNDESAWRIAEEEGRLITLEYENFYVIGTYVPNAGQNLERLNFRKDCWEPAMLRYIKTLENKKPVVYCGDLNVARTEYDMWNPENNFTSAGFTIEERNAMENLLGLETSTLDTIFELAELRKTAKETGNNVETIQQEYNPTGLVDAFTQLYGTNVLSPFTFWGYRSGGRKDNRGWRLDYFLLSQSLKSNIKAVSHGIEYIENDITKRTSDHAPIHLIFNPVSKVDPVTKE